MDERIITSEDAIDILDEYYIEPLEEEYEADRNFLKQTEDKQDSMIMSRQVAMRNIEKTSKHLATFALAKGLISNTVGKFKLTNDDCKYLYNKCNSLNALTNLYRLKNEPVKIKLELTVEEATYIEKLICKLIDYIEKDEEVLNETEDA